MTTLPNKNMDMFPVPVLWETRTHPDLGSHEDQSFMHEAIRANEVRQRNLNNEKTRVREILDNIEYRRHDGTWTLYLGVDDNRLYIQVKSAGTMPKDPKEQLKRLALAGVSFDYPYMTEASVRAAYLKMFPDEGPWSGRKWMLSPHMVLSEIVSTAYAAYERAEIHETKEAFRYKGAAVMGPHQHMDELADLMNRGILHDEIRSNGMQGA